MASSVCLTNPSDDTCMGNRGRPTVECNHMCIDRILSHGSIYSLGMNRPPYLVEDVLKVSGWDRVCVSARDENIVIVVEATEDIL